MKNKKLLEYAIKDHEDTDLLFEYVNLTISLYEKHWNKLLDPKYLEVFDEYEWVLKFIKFLSKLDKLNMDDLSELKFLLKDYKLNQELNISICDMDNAKDYIDTIDSLLSESLDYKNLVYSKSDKLGLEISVGEYRYKRTLEKDIENLLS